MIYDIQRYCVHDGHGIRTIIFFKGCQLRCPWCANPESQETGYQIGYYADKCIHCNTCEIVCSVGAVKEGHIDAGKCTLCGKCVQECPAEALTEFGLEMKPEEIAESVCRDIPFFRKSGGGVTFSGGEVTIQSDLMFQTMQILKERGIHIAIESNGLFSDEICTQLLEYVDQFLIDLKHTDEQQHKKMLGVSNRQIIKNLRRLSEKDLTIRIPLIRGFNDGEENLKKSAKFAKELGSQIDLLPFHNLGTSKYKALGMNYAYENVPAYPTDKLEECMEIIRHEGVLIE